MGEIDQLTRDNLRKAFEEAYTNKNPFSQSDVEHFQEKVIEIKKELRKADGRIADAKGIMKISGSAAYDQKDKDRIEVAEEFLIVEGAMCDDFWGDVGDLDNNKVADRQKFHLWEVILLREDKVCQETKIEFSHRGVRRNPEIRRKVFKSMYETHIKVLTALFGHSKVLPKDTSNQLEKVMNLFADVEPAVVLPDEDTISEEIPKVEPKVDRHTLEEARKEVGKKKEGGHKAIRGVVTG